jgi:hypothetical protein
MHAHAEHNNSSAQQQSTMHTSISAPMTMSEEQRPETTAQIMSDEEEDVELTEEDVQKKRKAAAANKLSREEREDLIHSLEHIVTVGSSVRRNEKRRREWKSRQQNTEQEDGIVIDSEEKGASHPDAALPDMMHAEDVRIYGKNGRSRGNWPTKNRVYPQDKEWDYEHGDCIQPLAFLEARLSDMPPLKRQRVDGSNLSTDKTNCTVSLEEVPRAMLARCWERAVHAASVSIDCSDSLQEQAEDPPSVPLNARTALDDHEKYSVNKAVQKCQELNIALQSNGSARSCPTCGIVFDTDEELRKHYYGRTDPSQRGCCWKTIQMTQYELLNQMLQQEVKDSAIGIIKTVMASVDSASRQAEPNNSPLRVHGWQDVLGMLDESIGASTRTRLQEPSTASTDDSRETMRYEPGKSPVVLNPSILRNAELRLIDRYADAPK